MKKLGIIGGLAWPSTIDYYRLLCSKANQHFAQQSASPPYPTPPIVIESLNMSATRVLRGHDDDPKSWSRFEQVFRDALLRLQASGAELAIIASNTPHMRLSGICEGLEFPVISILDVTAQAVVGSGASRALILGTPVTMYSDAYSRTLTELGIEVLPRLPDAEIGRLETLIDEDLYQGKIDSARYWLLDLCRSHVTDTANDVVCLACTELPLAFPEHCDDAFFRVDGIGFVNTSVAHVEAALAAVLP